MPRTPSSKRRNFTSEQKAEIVRRHMVDKIPVSDLCEEYGIQPSVFHGWHKQVTNNLASANDVVVAREIKHTSLYVHEVLDDLEH